MRWRSRAATRCHRAVTGLYIRKLALPRRPPPPTPEAGGRLRASKRANSHWLSRYSAPHLSAVAQRIVPLHFPSEPAVSIFIFSSSLPKATRPPPAGLYHTPHNYHQHSPNSLRSRCWLPCLPRLTTCPHLFLTRTRQLRAPLSLILVLLWRTRSARGAT